MNGGWLANVAASCAALCAGAERRRDAFCRQRNQSSHARVLWLSDHNDLSFAVLPFVWPKARIPAADVITIALLGAVFL